MQILRTATPIADNKNNIKHNFKSLGSAGTQALNYLATNPAVGAILVDVGSMGVPRTIVDSTRGVDAGIETGVREFSSTLNHAAAGFVGLGAGGQRGARGGGVGDAVVGRIGFLETDDLGPVEGDGGIVSFGGEGGDLGEAHAVADHEDDVADGRFRIVGRAAAAHAPAAGGTAPGSAAAPPGRRS